MNDSKITGVVVIEPIVSDDEKVLMITVANNYVKGRKISKTNFIRSYCYNKDVMRIIKNNIHVGSKIIIEGHLQNSEITINDKKIYSLRNIIDNIEFLKLTEKKEKEEEFDLFKDLFSVQDLKSQLNEISFLD